MSVKVIYFLTGELLIAEEATPIKATIPPTTILTGPVGIHISANPQGQPQLGLSDWLPFMAPPKILGMKKTVSVQTSQIVYQYDPTTELLNAYNNAFGGGIILSPGTGGIGSATK